MKPLTKTSGKLTPIQALRESAGAAIALPVLTGMIVALNSWSWRPGAIGLAVTLALAALLGPWQRLRDDEDMWLLDDTIPDAPPPSWRNLPTADLRQLQELHLQSRDRDPFEEWADHHVRAIHQDGHWHLFLMRRLSD